MTSCEREKLHEVLNAMIDGVLAPRLARVVENTISSFPEHSGDRASLTLFMN